MKIWRRMLAAFLLVSHNDADVVIDSQKKLRKRIQTSECSILHGKTVS